MNLIEQIIFIIKGLGITLQYTIVGLFLGLTGGLFLAILRRNTYLTLFIDFMVSLFRGTPLLLQLSFFYFALPYLTGIRLDLVYVGLISFGLNSAAYVTEIFRTGIQAIPQGQFEAAQALGISSFWLWKDIILPQVCKNIFPALINETISLLKETAIISMFGELDLTRRSQIIAANEFNYFMPTTVAGLCYYLVGLIIERCAKYFAKLYYANY